MLPEHAGVDILRAKNCPRVNIDVYINFRIDTDQQVFTTFYRIRDQVQDWAQRHGIHYTEKFHKGNYRVGLDRPEDFTVFFLTWNGPPYEILGDRLY